MDNIERINFLLDQEKPFAVWRMPHGNQINWKEGGLKVFEPEQDIDGFVFHPFDASLDSPLIITTEDHASEPLNIPCRDVATSQQVVDYEQYSYQVNRAVEEIKTGRLKKIVLSRIIEKKGLSNEQAGQAFFGLCQSFPDAFVYLFSAGAHTRWMGASPETLVSFEGDRGFTMSLAGTLPDEGNLEWSDKERIEQQIVTDYIVEKIKSSGALEVVAGQPFVSKAGKLLHLKTEIRFHIPEGLNRYGFVKVLHPTPAVCGSPKDEAIQLIRSLEQHHRTYYTGFLGPWSTKGAAQLFVNLRCMAFSVHRSHIYVGGGITAASVAEREWAETSWKAGTLSWLFDSK